MTTMSQTLVNLDTWESYVVSSRYRKVHVALVLLGLAINVALNYGRLGIFLHDPQGWTSYVPLNIFYQAQFLVLVIYTELTLRLKWGVLCTFFAAAPAAPILLYALATGPGVGQSEVTGVLVQESLLVAASLVMALLVERATRQRELGQTLALQLNDAQLQLKRKMAEVERLSHTVETADRQLNGLNALVRVNLNVLYDDLREIVRREQQQIDALPLTPEKIEFAQFLQSVNLVIDAKGNGRGNENGALAEKTTPPGPARESGFSDSSSFASKSRSE